MSQIEKATIKDAAQIHKLVNYFAEKDQMLPRPLSEIYENIRDYFVIRDGQQVVACGALHINWVDLAEIKSLAITEAWQKKGLGDLLVAACIKEARELNIPTIFCLTFKPDFFEKCGFMALRGKGDNFIENKRGNVYQPIFIGQKFFHQFLCILVVFIILIFKSK